MTKKILLTVGIALLLPFADVVGIPVILAYKKWTGRLPGWATT